MNRLLPTVALLALCLPAHGQDRPADEVEALKARVAALEARLAALERLAVRFAGESGDVHGYYAGDEPVPKPERVPGVGWLRKVPDVAFAKPKVLPYLSPTGGTTSWILSAVARGRPNRLLVAEYGFGPYDQFYYNPLVRICK